ncbi:MAG: tetratricopeptide repeat protein [Gemmatales bacterium]|nr:tetratricopeptide repeat protein [Gemmatales bacterium]MDW7994171.1 tetratricopeptide repeat protein [Gemmatales bacterium]
MSVEKPPRLQPPDIQAGNAAPSLPTVSSPAQPQDKPPLIASTESSFETTKPYEPLARTATWPPSEQAPLPPGESGLESSSSSSAEAVSPASASTGSQAPVDAPPVLQSTRYRLVHCIGRGGMGEVWLAEDLELNRPVAIKFARSPSLLWRFEREAQITALLQHPGIVPVFGRGQYGTQRYYVMQYVEGQRFDEAIEAFHRLLRQPADFERAEVRLKFVELLQRFVAVCRTIAYAHSRGVIHRDLKPHNIVLGQYGETVVLDWGLAKRLAEEEMQIGSHERQEDDESHTLPGTRMGTQAYMAPEQLEGGLATEQTDIFLLGATLYHVLVGKPPFAQGRPALRPRLVQPWVPPALEAICLKAMATMPRERYASASALAADLERWLADEPVSVYLEPWTQRWARWARRHRVLVSSLAAASLVAGMLLAGFTTVLGVKNRQLEDVNQELASALSREEAERQRAERNFHQAEAARALADQKRREAEQAQQLAELRQEQAERAAERARQAIELIASKEVLDQLTRKTHLSPEEKRILQALVSYYEEYARGVATNLEQKQRQARANFNLGRLYQALRQHQASEQAYRQAAVLFGALVAEHPQEPLYRQLLASTHNNLGVLLRHAGRIREAETCCQQALSLRTQLVAEYPQVPQYRHELASTHHNLATLWQQAGRFEEAAASYQQSVALSKKLVAEHPLVPEYRQQLAQAHSNLGVLLRELGRVEEAETSYRQALALYQELVAERPGIPEYREGLATTHNNLANLLWQTGRKNEAEASYRQALALREKLTAEHPVVPEYRQQLAQTYSNLGILLQKTGRRQEAEDSHRRALALFHELVAEHPTIPQYWERLAAAHINLAELLHHTGRTDEAEASYREVLALREKLAANYPQVPEYRRQLANTLAKLAVFYAENERITEVRIHLEQALRLRQGLVHDFPSVTDFQTDLAEALYDLVVLHLSEGNRENAFTYASQARQILHRLVKEHPELSKAHRLLKALDEAFRTFSGK